MTIRPKYETASRHNKITRPTKKQREAAYDAVEVRAKGICEGCEVQPAAQMHHRVYRSRGGEDTVSNLLHLCQKCHGIAHTAIGEQLGWSVRSGYDPQIVPIFHKVTQTWTRQADGAPVEPIPAIDAVEYM